MRSAALVFLAIGLLVLSIVPLPATTATVIMEAESYAQLTPPMRLVGNGDAVSAGGYVELPLGSGQGWRGQGTGNVTYRVDLPRDGLYRVWGRTLWQDGCTNAFFLSANQGEPMVFGNDAVFNRWHWVKGPSVRLGLGINYLRFSNHSDGTALDKLVITNDPLYLPEGLGDGITHFFDGFAGCDADNTGSWEFLSGTWRVVRAVADGASSANDCLAQWRPDGGEALGGFRTWRAYDARIRVMLTQAGAVGLAFYHRDSENTCRLTWETQSNETILRLEQVAAGTRRILAESRTTACQYDHWYALGYQDCGERLSCTLDGDPVLDAEYHGPRDGRIGLVTKGMGGVYFDNVEVFFH